VLVWPPASRAVLDRLKHGHPVFITGGEPGEATSDAEPDDAKDHAAGDSPDHASADAPYRAAGFLTAAAFPIREDGQLTAVLLAMFPRPIDELDIDERTLEAIGRVLDISFVNRSLRQVVAASENRYRALFERSPDALLVESSDGAIIDANPAAERLHGGVVTGRHVNELIEGEKLVVDVRSEAFIRDGVTNQAGIGRRLDGSTFPREVDLHALDIGGERRILAIVRDVTERQRLQAELVQAQKMEAIGQLVAGVAHELNNPLASIVAFSQLLRTDPDLPVDLRHQADMLVQEANRTRVIVQNLLDFARARPAERAPTDLRSLVDSVIGLQSYSFGKGGVDVVIDIPPDLPPILLDRAQMQQVLVNLTVNAAQAIRDSGIGGVLRIAAAPAGQPEGRPIVRIEIIDDGPGVPTELLDRLFMPFFTTKAPGRGTGLGLSVSFGIVAGHGGSLRHEAGPGGRGATFIIEMPIGDGSAAATAPPIGFAGPASAGTSGGTQTPSRSALPPAVIHAGPNGGPDRPFRVLVLDDETAIREFLGRALRRAGYEPILAPTGPEALALIRDDPPDAILCDHRMAGMNGTEFHDAVAAAVPELGRRFAFMSGDVLNPELREFAMARGILLLAKPFDIATVGRTVATLLGTETAA
jgi:two-component system, NtrC family, sensor kinase